MSTKMVLDSQWRPAQSDEGAGQQGTSPSTLLPLSAQAVFAQMFSAPPLRGGALTPELAALARTTWERVEAPRQQMGLTDVVPLGPTLALTEPRGYEGPTADWIAYPAAQEPWVKMGQYFIPAEEQTRLQRVLNAGLDMDEMYIVHQTPPGTLRYFGVNGVPPQLLGPPPSQQTLQTAQRLSERARRTLRPVDLTTPAVVGGIALGAAGLGLAAVAGMALMTAAAMGSMAIGLDPIILGVVSTKPQPQPGDPVFLYLLSMYVWQEEGYDVIHAPK